MAQRSDGSVSNEQLNAVVERIEALEAEKAGINDDIKAVYAEAKAEGYDVKVLRRLIRLRTKSQEERQEEEAILDTYMAALGMLPLFEGEGSS